jgi:hypothetical protein
MIAAGMTVIAVVVAGLTVALVARAGRRADVAAALVVTVLMVAEYALASSGVLREWTRRPTWRKLAMETRRRVTLDQRARSSVG